MKKEYTNNPNMSSTESETSKTDAEKQEEDSVVVTEVDPEAETAEKNESGSDEISSEAETESVDTPSEKSGIKMGGAAEKTDFDTTEQLRIAQESLRQNKENAKKMEADAEKSIDTAQMGEDSAEDLSEIGADEGVGDDSSADNPSFFSKIKNMFSGK